MLAPHRVVMSGIQPTGVPHIGNWLGAIDHWKQLQDSCSDGGIIVCIADLHSITVPHEPHTLRSLTARLNLLTYYLIVELLFSATVCNTVRPRLSDHRLSVRPVCDVGLLWPNGWMDQDETWHAGRPRPWPHYVRRGPSSLSPKGNSPPPIFGPYMLRPNGCIDQDAT